MINLSFGHISKEFIDFERIQDMLRGVISQIDFSSYSIPGGNSFLKEALIAKYFPKLQERNFCTSISTNLSVSICCELFASSRRVVLFTPTFLNYYKRFSSFGFHEVILYDYGKFLSGALEYQSMHQGDVCVFVIPDNPTGRMPSYAVLKENVEKIHAKGGISILDVSWAFSAYDPKKNIPLSVLADLVLQNDSVLLLGFTKLLGVSSIRCSGVVAGPDKITSFIERHDQLAVSCGAVDELLVTQILKNKDVIDWKTVRSHLRQQTELAWDILNGSGLRLRILRPDAGIFMFFYVEGLTNATKVSALCRERGLLVYPSGLFEKDDSGFRICIGGDKDNLTAGLAILLSAIGEELAVK